MKLFTLAQDLFYLWADHCIESVRIVNNSFRENDETLDEWKETREDLQNQINELARTRDMMIEDQQKYIK